jgi:hypothetical protein
MAIVLLGEDEAKFTIHRNVVTQSSDFFKNAINEHLQERDGIVRLRDGDATAFTVYSTYLYSGKVHTIVDEGTSDVASDAFDPDAGPNQHAELEDEIDSSSHAPPNMFAEWDILAECLVLADLLQDDGFFNCDPYNTAGDSIAF